MILPFTKLPSLKSLYTLTPYVFWEQGFSPVDFTPLKQISNITTLIYDESVLAPSDVFNSLGMFKGLKSFRWTSAPTCFAQSWEFVACSKGLGEALFAHKDTLEELYVDVIRHSDKDGKAKQKALSMDAILIGSFKEYTKLKTLAIDATSLCGHQDWAPSPHSLIDILPPKLESLTLFVHFTSAVTLLDGNAITALKHVYQNTFWPSKFLGMIQARPEKLQKVSFEFIRNPPLAWREVFDPEEFFENSPGLYQEAAEACAEANIAFGYKLGLQVNPDDERTVGLTEIPYFLEVIKKRNPGRDF